MRTGAQTEHTVCHAEQAGPEGRAAGGTGRYRVWHREAGAGQSRAPCVHVEAPVADGWAANIQGETAKAPQAAATREARHCRRKRSQRIGAPALPEWTDLVNTKYPFVLGTWLRQSKVLPLGERTMS